MRFSTVRDIWIVIVFLLIGFSLAELVFEDPVRESRFPHRIHPLLGITILQEIIGTPGTFFVGSDSSLLQMYRNNSGSWTFKVIVGTNKAGCIDGNFSVALLCLLSRLVQLQRDHSATGELIMASQSRMCLKLIDLHKREIRPYSKFMKNPSIVQPLMKYEPKFTELLNATLAGPTGLITEVVDGTTVAIYVSEYFMPRIRRIDIETQTIQIILDASERGERYYNFRDILRYDQHTFLLLSRYGMVEANTCTRQASYIFGGSEYKYDLMSSTIDGNFSVASLNNPLSFLRLSESEFVVVSKRYRRIRLVNLQQRKVETICISKRGGPIFPQEDPDQLRKCVINYPTSVTMVNGTVYIGDTSIISMKVQKEGPYFALWTVITIGIMMMLFITIEIICERYQVCSPEEEASTTTDDITESTRV